MPFNPSIHHRRSVRLSGYDYAAPGAYFITIDTHRAMCLFGEIVDGVMRLNDYGEIARAEWLKTPSIRSEIALDEFQIMPNHFHVIVIIMDCGDSIGAHGNAPINMDGVIPVGAHGNAPGDAAMDLNGGNSIRAHSRAPLRRSARSLGSLIGGFKTVVTIRINQFRRTPGAELWQRNYYEHIIRSEDELSRTRKYMRDNPLQWETDRED
jgi:putative transposase